MRFSLTLGAVLTALTMSGCSLKASDQEEIALMRSGLERASLAADGYGSETRDALQRASEMRTCSRYTLGNCALFESELMGDAHRMIMMEGKRAPRAEDEPGDPYFVREVLTFDGRGEFTGRSVRYMWQWNPVMHDFTRYYEDSYATDDTLLSRIYHENGVALDYRLFYRGAQDAYDRKHLREEGKDYRVLALSEEHEEGAGCMDHARPGRCRTDYTAYYPSGKVKARSVNNAETRYSENGEVSEYRDYSPEGRLRIVRRYFPAGTHSEVLEVQFNERGRMVSASCSNGADPLADGFRDWRILNCGIPED